MGHRPVRIDGPHMKGERSRNDGNGRMRLKRADTKASTLEREYNVELGIRSDATLAAMRARTGETAVTKVIARLRK